MLVVVVITIVIAWGVVRLIVIVGRRAILTVADARPGVGGGHGAGRGRRGGCRRERQRRRHVGFRRPRRILALGAGRPAVPRTAI